MSGYHHVILIVCFSALLLACFLGTAFHWDLDRVQRENRKLSEWPDFSRTAPSEWPAALDAYFNDHFGFRNTLVRHYRRIMRSAGVTDYHVIHGLDDWLFLNEDTIMRDFVGALKENETDLDGKIRRLISRRDWLKDRGIPYLFVIIPNKATIYPDKLPEDIARLQARSNRECFMERIERCEGLNVLDLTPAFLQARQAKEIYCSADTHWNFEGAFFGYTRITAALVGLLPDPPEAMDVAKLIRFDLDNLGDLAAMTVSPERYRKNLEKLWPKEAKEWSRDYITDPEFKTEETLPIDHKPLIKIHNPNGRYNAVIFHDSFGELLIDFLPHDFENTTMIWRYSNRTNLPLVVDRLKPDVIIEIVVERHLVDPVNGALMDEIGSDVGRSPDGL